MAKVYSVFLCVLLISVLFFPLTSAGRVLLDKPQKDDVSGKHSNGGNKIGVEGSHSSPAHSAKGHASPFHANPSHVVNPTVTGPKGTAYADSFPCEGRKCLRTEKCNPTKVRGCR
ncbi:uncharacterized protein LOC109122425 isoform X2 [Vitis vinifera]|uniref:uncharacterized protein LOC109122425 isoform X2 n=1 Tax=Vitis vinifera TaxID=29760 RepID=UPI0008FEC391|nr:uncharacterized protein LOC109122425 isoform X2 [Vitis vinifera]|eukprot:XP_019074771.1 PREDICTED: uncharacterized protein LOC109122425 isoform X2 [Vitis vinifera]